jgi:CubicO group peptidase (beta-lactamase class C family)
MESKPEADEFACARTERSRSIVHHRAFAAWSPRRGFGRIAALLSIGAALGGGATRAADAPGSARQIAGIVHRSMAKYHLRSAIVQVRENGRIAYTAALGESMPGVPATATMHFRNGAMAFTYMSTLLLEMVDRKKARLDDPLSKYLPDLPSAGKITLKNLANMTSGYPDYVYQPETLRIVGLEPFRQFTPEQLIHIGVSKPLEFAPGTNWGYSHTNYVILGRVLEKITGMPLDRAMQLYVFAPLRMRQTAAFSTPYIPEPAMHAYSSERRADLGIKAEVPFYEESTYWNPSWTTAAGAVETTDIADMTKSMEAVGLGTLLSPASHKAQVEPRLIGFGHPDPKCSACRTMTTAMSYGLGVVILGPWITQTKNFAGAGATSGYLPSKRLTISIATTLQPAAFDDKGNYPTPSTQMFVELANELGPGTLPAMKSQTGR